MQVVGLTQAKLAEVAGCTPTQLGLFLKSEASLNKDSLDKCLEVVGINLGIGLKRMEIAMEAAQRLGGSTVKKISSMDQYEMIRLTGLEEIGCLPNPTEAEFEKMIESGIIDYEATFPFFKSLVLHFYNIQGAKPTPKTVQNSFESLAKGLAFTPMAAMAAIGGLFMPSLIGVAIGALMMSKIYSKVAQNAWAPLLSIARSVVRKH